MIKRKRLGQHFLTSNSIAEKIVRAAKITNTDTVLEIGTGKGILINLLCKNAKKVISIDADKMLYEKAKKQFSNLPNLELQHGDGFKTGEKFDVLVSNLPYSKSREAIEWLTQQKFDRAVIMVQKEFAEKLLSNTEKRAISILAQYCLDIEKVLHVGKENFNPPPKIDSVVLSITSKRTLSLKMIHAVNRLFSYRRKTLQNILKQFDITSDSKKRLDEIDGDEIIKIAKQIA